MVKRVELSTAPIKDLIMYHLFKSSLIVLLATSSYSILYAQKCPVPISQHKSLEPICWQTTDKEASGNEAAANKDCLLTWKGYQWWLDYNAIPDPKQHPWWIRYKWAQGQAYDPRFIKIVNGELQLRIDQSDLGGGTQLNSSEAVLVGDKEGKPLGYGEYYAVVYAPPGFSNLDKNSVFGFFTYSTDGNKEPEIDILEISKWGGKANVNQAVEQKKINSRLASIMWNDDENTPAAHAQIGLQPWTSWPEDQNFQKYAIPEGIDTITAYMYWNGKDGEKKIRIKIFKGNIPFDKAKQENDTLYHFETTKQNDKYIPNDESCTRVHINFYLQHTQCKRWTDSEHIADPLSKKSETITIKDFKYVPLD